MKTQGQIGHRIPAIYWVCFQNISRMFSLKMSLLGLSDKTFLNEIKYQLIDILGFFGDTVGFFLDNDLDFDVVITIPQTGIKHCN